MLMKLTPVGIVHEQTKPGICGMNKMRIKLLSVDKWMKFIY
jgi:hypothetical protein